MKKILSLLVLTLVVATGCKSSKSPASAEAKKLAQNGVTYEYRAYTRGNKMDVVIKDWSITAAKGRPGEVAAESPKRVSDGDKKALVDETAKLNLDNLETLEAPSKKHQFDGALAATLTITTNGKSYTTPTFDHGNPPAEVKPLVEKIIALSELEKK